ncbi:YIP1 family protein [Aliikangiella sp. IMCC44653]
MDNNPSSISILNNILLSPQKAFADLTVNYPVLLPMGLVLVLNALLVVTLFTNIDYQWYTDHMVQLQAGELSKAEQTATRQAFEMMSPGVMAGIGAVSSALFMGVIFCLLALYFVIVSNVTNDGFQFKQWLSFVSWTSIPSLIAVLASFMVIFTSSNGQIAPESLNPLSFNELFFGLNAISGVGNILATSDITMLWSIGLMIIGYSAWTKKTMLNSSFIVLLPYVLYFGIRFAIA